MTLRVWRFVPNKPRSTSPNSLLTPALLGPAHQEGPHLDEAGGINVGILPAKAALPQPEGLRGVGVSHHGHPGKGSVAG